MISCKIGIISYSYKNPDDTILLGVINDKNKQEINKIYKYLKYLSPFIVKIKLDKIIIDNFEELLSFMKYFNIKLKPELKSNYKKKYYKFRCPVLYDLSCKCNLFDNISPKNFLSLFNTHTKTKLFIVLPINDVIIRGKILENCSYIPIDNNSYFLCIGDKRLFNTCSSALLNKRYLLTLGIKQDNICQINCSEDFPDIFIDVNDYANLLEFQEYDLIFLMSNEKSKQMLEHGRNLQRLGIINNKIKISFVCE